MRNKRQRIGQKGSQFEWKETKRLIKRTDSKLEKERKKHDEKQGDGIMLSNQYEMLAVEECVFHEVVQEGERAHGAFTALVTEDNLRCRRTRKAVAQRAMEEAQRKQEDVLRINELCKAIEKEENVKEQAEEKEDEEDDGEYYEEEDENG